MTSPRSATPWRPVAPRRAAAALAVATLAWLAPGLARADTLRIAASRGPLSLPLFVAQHEGFFAAEGLDAAFVDCIGGRRCVRLLLEGKADVATSAEMAVVQEAFAHAEVAIVATMVHASDNLKLIARTGSGIAASDQLPGRRVGVMVGTTAQYQLELHLLDVGIDPRRVTMVALQPEEVAAALKDARVDAAVVWEPYAYAALHGADAAGVRLPLAGGYIENYTLVARRTPLAQHDDAIVRLLRAVERAEQFIQGRPARAQAILRERLELEQGFVDWVWAGLAWRLSLDQALLSTMEGEMRWAQRERHVAEGARPNVLTLVHPGPLRTVKPAAVGIGD
ncbi:MAG: NrtA/SsuA/CpmA family ABC transporter substrate-binding protein [Burkholderiales bacterium]|nr:NrtA/SsuA/CpmA family ABC transporter substrate-binding protein [Burkholderiales bacterium]